MSTMEMRLLALVNGLTVPPTAFGPPGSEGAGGGHRPDEQNRPANVSLN